MLGRKQRRLAISLDDLRQINPKMLNHIIYTPAESIKIFEEVLTNIVRGLAEMTKLNNFQYRIAFCGNFGINHITPRGLSCDLLN
mmetsp:Transcript_7794/g.1012  ORF Transcript_7794/g.1012 Transcript_7794/m.1012 type:complete len:85 (-) Transcript_7794:463-717(-)